MDCTRCGEKVSEGTNFCPKCGAALGVAQPSTSRIPSRLPKRQDMLGFMSIGVVLIILALTFLRHPIDSSVIIDYFESMASEGGFIKPPLILFNPAIFLLSAAGAWGIILSGLRISFWRSLRPALGDLLGGCFSFFCAYLLTNYAADAFTGRTTLAYFVVAIGLLVTINAIIYFALPPRLEGSKAPS